MSRAFCWPIPGSFTRNAWSPRSIARAIFAIGCENARAAVFGPMLATRHQRFEEFALDRVRESEKREAPAVAFEREGRIDLERHAARGSSSRTFSATHGARMTS